MNDVERKLYADTLAESEADRSNLKRRIETLEAELEAVKRERDTARSFVEWCFLENVWCGSDIDGGDAQRAAEERGLLHCIAYDPEKHGPCEFGSDKGDTWFSFAWPTLRTAGHHDYQEDEL